MTVTVTREQALRLATALLNDVDETGEGPFGVTGAAYAMLKEFILEPLQLEEVMVAVEATDDRFYLTIDEESEEDG